MRCQSQAGHTTRRPPIAKKASTCGDGIITCCATAGFAGSSSAPSLYRDILHEKGEIQNQAIPPRSRRQRTHAVDHTRLQPLSSMSVDIHHATPTHGREHGEWHLRRRDWTWICRGRCKRRKRRRQRFKWRIAEEGRGVGSGGGLWRSCREETRKE